MFAVSEKEEVEEVAQVVEVVDLYGTQCWGQPHLLFVGQHKTKDDLLLVAVPARQIDGRFLTVRITKRGQHLVPLSAALVYGGGKEKKRQLLGAGMGALSSLLGKGEEEAGALAPLLLEALSKEHPEHLFHEVTQQQRAAADLRALEQQHPQRKKSFKVAVLYATGQEQSLAEVFAHKEAPEPFWRWLGLVAQRISLKGWRKYRGDFGAEVEADTYYTEWRGIEVMFHVALWLNPEQHRRLIGNDVVVLLYHDPPLNGGGPPPPYDPTPLNALGTVPQIFAVVQRHPEAALDAYRLDFFARPNIKPYRPALARDQLWRAIELQDWLLTKAYNGYCAALACPPMNRLYEVPRAAALAELVARYPPESEEEVKRRKRGEARKRLIVQQGTRDPLFLLVAVGRSLPPTAGGGKELKEAQVVVGVAEEEQRTKAIKVAALPEWKETLVFNVLGVDPASTPVRVQLRSKDKVVAQAEIPFKAICAALKHDKWWELSLPHPKKGLQGGLDEPPRTPDGTTTAAASLQLVFSLTGQGAALCPLCGLFLGASPLVLYAEKRYHDACIACSTCATRLEGAEFRVNKGRFYCTRCFTKQGLQDDEEEAPGPPTTTSTPLLRSGSATDELLPSKTAPAVVLTAAAPLSAREKERRSVAPSGSGLLANNHPHEWTTAAFGPLDDCGFCGTALGSLLKKEDGFQCAQCEYPAHKHCRDLVPGNCSRDPKSQVLHAHVTRGGDGDGALGKFKNQFRKSIRNVSSRSLKKSDKPKEDKEEKEKKEKKEEEREKKEADQ